jgi:zona occludens toxin
MPINVYCGLMRSGKSYEVVSEVIVPSIRKGRRVVTNVDGISQDAIHAYLQKKHPEDDASKYGVVLHVTNAQVFEPDFFPYYDDKKDAHTDTTVQPGDLVAIDEAWRFWGEKMKIQKNHQSFFLEHGHFTHPETHVACDLVLMIQDMGTLHRSLKAVVAFVFRTHRKAALGLGNTYSVNGYEGNRMNKATRIGTWVRKYHKDVFPLYSSFKGGAQGKLVNADNRQNMFAQKKFLWYLVGYVVLLVFAVTTIYSFFSRGEKSPAAAGPTAPLSPVRAAGPVPVVVPQRATVVPVNETWRVAGSMYAGGKGWVVLVNQSGAVRVESPSAFSNSGVAVVGDVDGTKVTAWSGPVGQTSAIVGGQQPAAVPLPAPAGIVGGR